MKKQVREGSVIVLLLLFFSALLISTINLMRRSAYMTDIAYKRQQYLARYWATEGLMRYGLALCKANHAALQSRAEQGVIDTEVVIDSWPCAAQGMYRGRIKIEVDPSSHTYGVKSLLLNEKNIFLCGLRGQACVRLQEKTTGNADHKSVVWSLATIHNITNEHA